MKKFFVLKSPAPAGFFLVLLMSSAAAVTFEGPVIEITAQDPNAASICVVNPNLCIAGGGYRPSWASPPPDLPLDVIPPGAAVSADEVNYQVIEKILRMNCKQLKDEANQKNEEINRLETARMNVAGKLQILVPRANQMDRDYAAARNSLFVCALSSRGPMPTPTGHATATQELGTTAVIPRPVQTPKGSRTLRGKNMNAWVAKRIS